MDAVGAAFLGESLEIEQRGLGEFVVFLEKHLKLVDDNDDARHLSRRLLLAVPGDVVPEGANDRCPTLELVHQVLQDGRTVGPVALET